MAKKKKTTEKKARVHKDLEGFEIKVNPLGEISSNYDIDRINDFLDKNVRDKKLVHTQGKDEDDELYPIEQSEEDTEENEADFLPGASSELDDIDEEEKPKKSKRK
ncbi:hypothetical protein [Adhaeribacter pallidiroseus]|uniref:Uncharacterized protein n=1 Tax=Adhaeribacter pallidiroseus TaxID=2072847 RepID=A0A369QLS8_9BACT|nr:hypothetical protein [Adhaeribacter pallidiroseus]RDC65881.1 hypothetical protein AHMF7616_04512 [Adhaeribacter pallidiroseus]